jgi:hypothetical protein
MEDEKSARDTLAKSWETNADQCPRFRKGVRFTEYAFDGQLNTHRNVATVVLMVKYSKCICQDMLYERSHGNLTWAKGPVRARRQA